MSSDPESQSWRAGVNKIWSQRVKLPELQPVHSTLVQKSMGCDCSRVIQKSQLWILAGPQCLFFTTKYLCNKYIFHDLKFYFKLVLDLPQRVYDIVYGKVSPQNLLVIHGVWSSPSRAHPKLKSSVETKPWVRRGSLGLGLTLLTLATNFSNH